jgi:NACalpha-BTF3-like transcription factor
MSNSTDTVSKLMADAVQGVEDFDSANRVVFITKDDEPIVIDDPEPLMKALEQEMNSCLKSLPETTVVGPMISGAGVVRFKKQPEDLNAIDFLLKEARRYVGLMVNVSAAFAVDPDDSLTWPHLRELGASEGWQVFEDTFKAYQEALDHAYSEKEELV